MIGSGDGSRLEDEDSGDGSGLMVMGSGSVLEMNFSCIVLF